MTTPIKLGAKKLTRQQKIAAAHTATADQPIRLGPREPLPEQRTEEPARVVEPAPEAVALASELGGYLQYVPAREGATDLELLVHAQRGIVNAGIAVEGGLGSLERDYALTAGRYLDDVTRTKAYKAAGHKSVEAFAATLDLSRKDVYRLRDAVVVYGDIADLVTKPLNERTIRELAIAHRESGSCRDVYMEAERTGRLNSTGVVEVRRLLVAGALTEIIESEPEGKPDVPAVERLTRAFKAGKLADIEVVKEAAKNNPEVVQAYADGLKAQYDAAMAALKG